MGSKFIGAWETAKDRYKRYKHIGSEYDEQYHDYESGPKIENEPSGSISGSFVGIIVVFAMVFGLMFFGSQSVGAGIMAVIIMLIFFPIVGLVMLLSLLKKSPKPAVNPTGNPLTNPLPRWVGKVAVAVVALIVLYPFLSVLFAVWAYS